MNPNYRSILLTYDGEGVQRKLEVLDGLERELTAANAEIDRLKAGGCARTQYCQEAADAQAKVKELQDRLSIASEYLLDLLAEWKWKRGAGERNDKQYNELSNFISAIDAARSNHP